MLKLSYLMLFACITLGLPGLSAAEMLMQPGQWEHTIQMNMPGMPQAPGPITTSECLTPEQASDLEGALARMKKQNDSQCQLEDVSHEGNSVRWRMNCTGPMTVTGEGEMTYQSDTSYTGSMVMRMNGPHGNMDMTQQLSGRRVGDCKQ